MLDAIGSVQWPCNEKAPLGTPIMHIDGFVRGKGKFIRTEYVATDERTGPRFPLLLTTGRILSASTMSARRRGAPRTSSGTREDRLEIHPHDAEKRGMRDGDWVRLTSRSGETTLRALITDRVSPGVVYTTFHHPDTQANVITTDFSDWATNCPEYKVTAVQVGAVQRPVANGSATMTSRRSSSRRIAGSWKRRSSLWPRAAKPRPQIIAPCAPRRRHCGCQPHGAGGDAGGVFLCRHHACGDDGEPGRFRGFRARLLADRRHHRRAATRSRRSRSRIMAPASTSRSG